MLPHARIGGSGGPTGALTEEAIHQLEQAEEATVDDKGQARHAHQEDERESTDCGEEDEQGQLAADASQSGGPLEGVAPAERPFSFAPARWSAAALAPAAPASAKVPAQQDRANERFCFGAPSSLGPARPPPRATPFSQATKQASFSSLAAATSFNSLASSAEEKADKGEAQAERAAVTGVKRAREPCVLEGWLAANHVASYVFL